MKQSADRRLKRSFGGDLVAAVIALLVNVAHRKHISATMVSLGPGVANKYFNRLCRGSPIMSAAYS